MILYSTRARIAGDAAEAMAWAHDVTALVNRLTGHTAEVAARVGGSLDIVWLSRLDSMAALETYLAAWQSHPEYLAMAKVAADNGLVDIGSIESAIWRTL